MVVAAVITTASVVAQSRQRIIKQAASTGSHGGRLGLSPILGLRSCRLRPSYRRLISLSSQQSVFREFAKSHPREHEEVQKFSALSETWWDPSKNPLIAMNTARMQFIRDAVQRYGDSASIVRGTHQASTSSLTSMLPFLGQRALDIGCGGGLLSESLARLGANVIGIDPSQSLIEVAKHHGQVHADYETQQRLQYITGMTVQEFAASTTTSTTYTTIGSETLPQQQVFDIVCCLEVLEHVPDPAGLLETACQLLKPNTGLLFVSTINRTLQSYWSTIVGAEYLLRLLPMGTHDWNSYRSPQEVNALLSPHHVYPVETVGMVLPSVCTVVPSVLLQSPGHASATWKWRLDPNDTNVNWIACYRKGSGKER